MLLLSGSRSEVSLCSSVALMNATVESVSQFQTIYCYCKTYTMFFARSLHNKYVIKLIETFCCDDSSFCSRNQFGADITFRVIVVLRSFH